MTAFDLLDGALKLLDEEFKDHEFDILEDDDPLSMNEIPLVPSTKLMFFLLHDILHTTYELIPNLYDDDIAIHMKYKTEYEEILLLLFELTTWIYTRNEQHIINTSKILDHCIKNTHSLCKLNIESFIIDIIAQYSTIPVTPFQFDTNILSSHNCTQLIFNRPHNDTVSFANATQDYINIISNEPVIDCVLDTFILNKGDEMWISLINKNDYKQTDWIRGSENRKSISYYGAREHEICVTNTTQYGLGWDCGFGSIQSLNRLLKKKIPWYCKYDWITIYVDNKNDCVYFYKNKKLVAKITDILSTLGDTLYYMVMVDDQIDQLFVEKATNI
eukprot:298452_1